MTCKDCVHYERCAWFAEKLARKRIFIDFNINIQADKECEHFKNKETFIEVRRNDRQEKECEQCINELKSVAEWFTEHGKNTNTAVIGISKKAIEIIEQLNGNLKFVRGTVDRQKAEIEKIQQNLAQCENGYSQELHRANFEIKSIKQKYDLAVAEREANVKGFTAELEKAKAEAVKAFAERLKERAEENWYNYNIYVFCEELDDLLKEMGVK